MAWASTGPKKFIFAGASLYQKDEYFMASCMQVLVVPLPSAESHTFVMVKVVQEMAARGHQVLVRMPSCP